MSTQDILSCSASTPSSTKRNNSLNFKLKTKAYSGFTLVELIVVITILVILWTIAFLNLWGFQGNARDSRRISDITNITKGLDIFSIKNGIFPTPDSKSIALTVSGVLIGTQWYVGANVLSIIRMSDTKDPLDGTYYTYTINADNTKYQILSLMEDSSTKLTNVPVLIPQAFAGYETRTPSVKGDTLGILLGSTGSTMNQPIQELYNAGSFTGVEFMTNNVEYTAVFDEKSKVSGTGARLSEALLIYNKSLASVFDQSLVAYWDMETVTPKGQLENFISAQHGECSFNKTFYPCAGNPGLQIVDGNGNVKNGKAMSFDGTGASVITKAYNSKLSFTSNFTLSAWIRPKSYHMVGYYALKNLILSSGPASTYNYALQVSDSGTISFIKRTWHESLIFTNFTGIPSMTDKWTLVTLTVVPGSLPTNNTGSLYINGVLSSTKTIGTLAPGTLYGQDPIMIGGLWTWLSKNQTTWVIWDVWESLFSGLIDEVRIYNRALSATEVQKLYDKTK